MANQSFWTVIGVESMGGVEVTTWYAVAPQGVLIRTVTRTYIADANFPLSVRNVAQSESMVFVPGAQVLDNQLK